VGLKEDKNSTLFTMLHRLCEQKGYEIAIPAMRKILDEDPNVQIVIGGPADADGRYFMNELAWMELQYRGRFKYTGGYFLDHIKMLTPFFVFKNFPDHVLGSLVIC